MTIVYNGNRANYNPHTHKAIRTATIYYNEEDNFDCQVPEYVIKVLEINGCPPPPVGVSGSFDIEVEDRDEYNELLRVYKDAKKGAKLNAKFFPKTSVLYYPN